MENINCQIMTEFQGGERLYRILCPSHMKEIERNKYYRAIIELLPDGRMVKVVLGAPPIQKTIDYTSDVDVLYFLIERDQDLDTTLTSIKSLTLVAPFPDDEMQVLKKKLVPAALKN